MIGITMPDFSLIIISHNKPVLVKQAIQSLLDQTHQNWETILVDSGLLLRQGFFDYLKDPRITVEESGETPDLPKTKNMASWVCNRVLNSGRLKGELIMSLCDDDLLYPDAFKTFWNFYVQHQREPQAMYSSQDVGFVDARGKVIRVGTKFADQPAGRFCNGRKIDFQIDYLQFCHTAKLLDRYREVYQTTEYFSENRAHATHADGIFMENVGALTTVHNINQVLSMNRRARDSINYPASGFTLVRTFLYLKLLPLLRRLKGEK
jgi:spore maturation protein CgeD